MSATRGPCHSIDKPVLVLGSPREFHMRSILIGSVVTIVVMLLYPFITMLGLALTLDALFRDHFWRLPNSLALVGAYPFQFILLPLNYLNPYICFRLRKRFGEKSIAFPTFDVQIAFKPRHYRGLRGILDDADDIGRLTVLPGGLQFKGDHIQLQLPLEHIQNARVRNHWHRCSRVHLMTNAFAGVDSIEIGFREASDLFSDRRGVERILESIRRSMAPTN